MRRVTSLVAVVATATLALAGCASSSSGGTSTTPSASTAATSAAATDTASAAASPSDTGSASAAPAAGSVKVGLAYDIGGRGDKSFNDAAAAGLDKAVADLKVDKKELEASAGEKDAQKEERLRLLAQGGYNPVIAIGFAYAPALTKVAKDFPNTKFAIVDDASITLPNVTPLVFAENQGSFLVGVIAAQASKTGNIGYIGGVLTPLLQKFEAGYTAGVKAVKPDAKVQVKYLTAAAALKPFILTSMLKHVDVSVYDMVKSAVDKKPLTGKQTFDLKVDGVGYSTSNAAVQPFTAKADEYKKQIVDGTLTVPEKP